MIPKIIHYCWFGKNPLPSLAIKCIESWKKFFPDYEIKEWNEDNFDVSIIPYTAEAYKVKKYAFVSDYARFWILYKYGGLYFDTDVEVIKPMDNIIAKGNFMGCEQEYDPKSIDKDVITLGVAPGLGLGVTPNLYFIKELIDMYATLKFINSDGTYNQTTVVQYTTNLLCNHGLQYTNKIQKVADIWIYPKEYFCPINTFDGKMHKTENTYTIHHYAQSWVSPSHRILRNLILRIGGEIEKNTTKILHVLSSNQFSGAENVACQIISLFKQDANIEMIYCSVNGQISQALKERNIRFVPIKNLSVKEVKKVLQRERPDIIHAHDMKASFVCSLAKNTQQRLISHIHNNGFDNRGITMKSIAYLLPAKKAEHIFYVSNSCYSGYKFSNWFKKKSSILRNIIDLDTLRKKVSDDTNKYNYDIAFVGRLTYPKNPQRLIGVLSKVIEQIPNCKVAIVGTGELEQECKDMVTKLSLKNIEFLGFMQNPLKVLHDSKVMLMTSRWEGTPMCALEALALGVPIVATPTDGLKDIVKNDYDGYINGEDKELVKSLINIITNKELRERLSQNCINVSKEINDKEKYKQELVKVYKV